ncbi:MAG: hypothetical protein LBL20_06305, partial [Treponema sp.]|nr:hypothetical protein [Treponema sp.]
MLDVIAAQHVERRKYSSTHARVYRIDQIKQHPAQKKRPRRKKDRGALWRLPGSFRAFLEKKEAVPGGREDPVLPGKKEKVPLPKKFAFLREKAAPKKAGAKPASPAMI